VSVNEATPRTDPTVVYTGNAQSNVIVMNTFTLPKQAGRMTDRDRSKKEHDDAMQKTAIQHN